MSRLGLLYTLAFAASLLIVSAVVLPKIVERTLKKGGGNDSVRWVFHGAKVEFPFALRGDSLVVEFGEHKGVVHAPRLSFDPFAYRAKSLPFFSLTMSRLHLDLSAVDSSSTSDSESDSSSFNADLTRLQRWLIIPFQSTLVIDEIEVALPQERLFASDLRFHSLGWQGAGLIIEELRVPQYSLPLRLAGQLHWSASDSLRAMIRINSSSDSLAIRAQALYSDIRLYRAEIEAGIALPAQSIPALRSNPLTLQQVHLRTTIQGEEEISTPSHSGTLTLQSDSLSPLPPMRWALRWKGRGVRAEATIAGNGNPGEEIRLSVSGSPASLQASGRVHGLSIEVSDEKMPIDFTLHRADWKEGELLAHLSTTHGTDVNIEVDDFAPLHGTVQIRPEASDPWAGIWTDYQTTFDNGEIRGEFNNRLVALHVRLNDVQAYGFEVDTLVTRVKIDNSGLLFWDAKLVRDSTDYPLKGEIYPGDQKQIRFSVDFPDQGKAELYGDISNYLTVQAKRLPLRYLPFGKESHTFSLLGTADASWKREMQSGKSSGILRLVTTLDNTTAPMRMRARFNQSGDTLEIDTLKVVQGKNALHGSALLSPGRKTRLPGGLLKVELGTEGLDLAPLLAPLMGKNKIRGKLSGNILFDDNFGLEGKLFFDSLALIGEGGMMLESPRLSLSADNDKLQLFGRLHNPVDPLWDGDLALTAEDLFYSTRKMAAAIATDGGAVAWITAATNDMETFAGNFNARGKWNVPSSEVALDSLSLSGEFSWAPAKGFSTLQLDAKQSSGSLSFGEKILLPLRTSASVKNARAEVSAFLENDQKQQFKLDFVYDLAEMEVKKIEFGTKQFDLALSSTQLLSIERFQGTLSDNRLQFSTPRLRYTDRFDSKSRLTAALTDVEGVYTIAPKEMRSGLDLAVRIDTLLYVNKGLAELSAWGLLQMVPELLSSKSSEAKKSSGSSFGQPINIDLQIREAANSSIAIHTNIFQLPLSVNLNVRGTDQNPILTGDLRASDDGWLTLQKDRYSIPSASVSWESQAINRGNIDVQAMRTLHFCKTSGTLHDEEESCDVALVVSGTLERVALNARSQGCSEELSFRHALQSLQLGCISTDNEQNILGSGLQAAEEILEDASKDLAGIVNRKIGSDLFGAPKFDLARGAQNYLDNKEGDLDSASISGELPFYLSNDSTLILNIGYTKATGSEATYNDLFRGGVRWRFHNGNTPEDEWQGIYFLEAGVQWRRFLSTTEGEHETENRMELNIGASHEVGFWGDCLFGRCRDQRGRKSEEEFQDEL